MPVMAIERVVAYYRNQIKAPKQWKFGGKFKREEAKNKFFINVLEALLNIYYGIGGSFEYVLLY